MRIENKKLVINFPPVLYDLLQWLLFPVNYVLGLLCYIQPGNNKWNNSGYKDLDTSGTGIELEELKQLILTKSNHVYTQEDIVRLYDSLPTVSAEKDLINKVWSGKILRTNCSALDFAYWVIALPLKLLGFQWGKRYCTAKTGDPLFLRWLNLFFIPLPMWGNVSMVDVKWRDEVTATMDYDHQPWKDYFKLLSDENGQTVMLGVWTHKDLAGGWFTLTLDKSVTATGK